MKQEFIPLNKVAAVHKAFPSANWNDMAYMATYGRASEAKGIQEVFPKASWDELVLMSRYGTADDVKHCKEDFPGASVVDVVKMVKGGTYEEIQMVRSYFDNTSMQDIHALLGTRRFSRWYADNRKVIKKLAIVTPIFALALHGLTGELALTLFADPAMVASTLAPPAKGAVVQTSFFGGKGAILLHMLVAGFFTLVVSSFLKFTGRGDLIPLVAFVGGGIILYEVIGLFNDIYLAIKTMLSM